MRILKCTLNNVSERKRKMFGLNTHTTSLPPGVIACKINSLLGAECIIITLALKCDVSGLLLFGFVSCIHSQKKKL